MLEKIPTQEELQQLLGPETHAAWRSLCAAIDNAYDMEQLWDDGGKRWTYEYKYRRGGKTLCTWYLKEKAMGLLIIFGKAEREKFENDRASYSEAIRNTYDAATTYHDGKWMTLAITDTQVQHDIMKLLLIKRKPNRK